MAVPINTDFLVYKQRCLRVRRQRKVPADTKVLAEPHEEHPLSSLRNTIISSVHQLSHNAIIEAASATTRVVLLKPREVVDPFFVGALTDLRMLHLESD